MGAACCVSARDRTVQYGTRNENLHRNIRHSPSWSFRWDNRVRVVEEDALDRKASIRVSAHASDGGSSLETYIIGSRGKSPVNEAMTRSLGTSASGKSISTKLSMEGKESAGSPQVSLPASLKLSPSAHSTQSELTSPISSSQNHWHPPASVPPGWAYGSARHELSQGILDSQISVRNSPTMISFSEEGQVSHSLPAGSNESITHSVGRSSDGWSLLAFSELVSTSQRDMQSVSSKSWNVACDKTTKSSDRNMSSRPMDLQTCGVCSKLFRAKSPWSSQKIFVGNELSVVAVLICGHVYHAECLEHVTPEINKYDPACPVCSFGEKKALQLSAKVLKSEKDARARTYKKFKNRVMDTDDSMEFGNWNRDDVHEVKGHKLVMSSSVKISSSAKPFFRRHFSFGSKGAKSTLETTPRTRKGLFWVKTSKE
ncbi:hypothetical protein Droror1_Dr00001173 [Drosera rotundifolia]